MPAKPRPKLAEIDVRSLPPDGPLEHRPPTPRAIRDAACALEHSVGGRGALVDALLPYATSDDQLRLIGMLADPMSDRYDLGVLLATEKIPLSTLVGMLRDAKLAAAHVEALGHIASTLPAVARSVMERALPSKTVCPDCDGVRFFTADPTDADPNPSPTPCPTCNGRGVRFRETTLAEQKLALELGKLLTKSPGVAVSVNQTNQSATVLTSGVSYDDFTRVTDRLLYPDQRRRARPSPSPSTPASDVIDLPSVDQEVPPNESR